MSDQSDEDKQHAPSQKRLEEARKQGQVPRSQEITTAAVYGGLLASALIGGSFVSSALISPSIYLMAHAPRLQGAEDGHFMAATAPLLKGGALALAILVLPMILLALGSILAQRGLVITPDKLRPRLSRISLLANARQKFGLDGLMEFAKNVIRMMAVSGILIWQGIHHLDQIVLMSQSDPVLSVLAVCQLLGRFLVDVTLFTAVVGLGDLLWQRFRHLQRNRMSHQEAMDEAKESEGDPHLKGHRRRRGQEIALSSMLADVAKADVVIVNPTHYAVALRWKRTDRHAPVCLAKGTDEVAARIRERANLAGIPLHRDPPTARALHATVELGQPIRPEQYRAVAAAIRFAEKMRKRSGPRK